jgi:hypothetical protein
MENVFLTVKFQTIDTRGNWLCYGLMLASYPSGQVLFSTQGVCDRPTTHFDEHTKKFWLAHHTALEMIQTYPAQTVSIGEAQLCNCISYLLHAYPKAYLISDNPQLDMRILNNIMIAHGREPVYYRNNMTYYQCICTWSFQLSVLSLLHIGQHQIVSFLQSKFICKSREVDRYFGPKHTPIADAARVLSRHFKILDVLSVVSGSI